MATLVERSKKFKANIDSVFPVTIELMKELYERGTKTVSVRNIRTRLKIPSEERKLMRKVANTLKHLENMGLLELISGPPNRYVIKPQFPIEAQKIIRTYLRSDYVGGTLQKRGGDGIE